VTASDVAQALGCAKFGNQRTFFQKKCGAADEQAAFDASLPPLKWGVMFEPVAQAVYSAVNLGVRVHEFGLLRHPTLPFVGASPDGITDLGVMLEIKCPWRRRIVEGEVPMQYYYQIQAQLAVCGLQECDYFECEFFETPDGPTDEAWAGRDAWHERGAFAEVLAPPRAVDPGAAPTVQPVDPPTFEYPTRMFGAPAELEAWLETLRAEHGAERVVAHWWVLRRQAASRIQYDAAFSDDMFQRLAVVWQRTLDYRGDRDKYLDEVGAAAPPAPPSTSPSALYGAQADAEAIAQFGSGFAFVE
jgi:putative phage-type endonuclease